jgi:hypothetical protein
MRPERKKFEPLAAPPSAIEHGGYEVLRAVIVEGGLHVTLVRGFDDPAVWGLLLADIARHASRVFASEDGRDESETITAIRSMFDAEMDNETDPGTTAALS